MARESLPVDDVLDDLVTALRGGRNAVLVAPPGAGKTTRVPQAIVDAGLLRAGEAVLVLEPRRLAARLAARRIASERGARLGDEVGYQVRFDDRTSAKTRIAFLTEGILTRRIQGDPLLEGAGVVVLDELHERSIHADLALAFLREIQETVRPELRIVAMSATLDAGPVSVFLGDGAIIESQGRLFPVSMAWLEEPDDRPIPERVVSGVRRMLRQGDDAGDILAFLPGAGEIRRAEEQLRAVLDPSIDLCPLYGELSAEAQDRAVDRGPRRKVVLATNIAESSLTIEGVTTVVDGGYAKVLRHDPALGIDRLDLVRISRKSADQRAGRAGRLGPGRALRLWTEKEDRLLAASEAPEIARVDLAPVVLEVVRWSRADPRAFGWFERPPDAMIERALGLLVRLGALPASGYHLTPLGERLAELPLHPRLARMLIAARERGVAEGGALVAALASEREILRRSQHRGRVSAGPSDVLHRLELFRELERARFAPAAAERLGLDLGAARAVSAVRDRLLELARRLATRGKVEGRVDDEEEPLLRALLAGFPDRVARRRARGDDRVVLASGGSARLAPESVVKDAELLVAVDVEGGGRAGREAVVHVASAIERRWLEEDTGGVEVEVSARFARDREVVESIREVRYGDLVLETRPGRAEDAEKVAAVLAEEAAKDLDRALPLDEGAALLVARLAFLARTMPELDLALPAGDVRRALLPALVEGRRSFAELRSIDLGGAIMSALPPAAARALEVNAPERIEVPSGRKVELRYAPDGPPVLSVRLQEVFGLMKTPRIAGGRVAVKMELLAPNMRPVQVTQDLESFWASTYSEVRNELRRRYPKHQWPEDPREGDPRKKPGRRPR